MRGGLELSLKTVVMAILALMALLIATLYISGASKGLFGKLSIFQSETLDTSIEGKLKITEGGADIVSCPGYIIDAGECASDQKCEPNQQVICVPKPQYALSQCQRGAVSVKGHKFDSITTCKSKCPAACECRPGYDCR